MDTSKTSNLRVLTAPKSNKQEFSLLCAYFLDSLDPNVYADSLERICNRLRTGFLLEMVTYLHPQRMVLCWIKVSVLSNLIVRLLNYLPQRVKHNSQSTMYFW